MELLSIGHAGADLLFLGFTGLKNLALDAISSGLRRRDFLKTGL
jgi:hypothetical protein